MNCQKCNNGFEIRAKDREFYEKFQVPQPTLCPDCRMQKRLCFRNERSLYKRTSSLSGQAIISIYRPETKFPVYSQEEWWSDKWEALDYGMDFDFNRTFFEQFQELAAKVPRIALFNVNPTNSEFCQQAYNNKNCYLCMVLKDCEDCMYVSHSNNLTDTYDCTFMQNSELCYECIDSEKLYSCIGSQSCQNSADLIFCFDCIGCQNCAGCYGLRNKQYHIMNKPCSKEEYAEKIKNLQLNTFSGYQNCKNFLAKTAENVPHRLNRNLNTENSFGDYLINAKDCYFCFNSFEIQDCSYCTWIFKSHDCLDVYGMGYGEWVLEGLGVEKLNNCAFNTFVSDSSDAWYSDHSFYSMYIFGCVGVRNKKYCIFNRQYSAEEYENLRGKIIEHMQKNGEWGQFFPHRISPFCYNETAANDYFPLTKEAALKNGYIWYDTPLSEYQASRINLQENIQEETSEIVNQILTCHNCQKNYRLVAGEFNFYKKRGLPIPRKCPDCRYHERLGKRNPAKIYSRKCARCQKDISTTYPPERKEEIVCEECYKLATN